MAKALRIVLLSHGADDFALLHAACERAGHQPVGYVSARSRRPAGPTSAASRAVVNDVMATIPDGIDLLLPARAASLKHAVTGYHPDLLVSYCFPWRIPKSVLRIPRLGAVNIHSSLLPRYRGPIPVHWAIRNGDREIGVTIHWMDDDFDTGPIIIQKGGIAVAEDAVADQLFGHVAALIPDLLVDALALVKAGYEGDPQEPSAASYAGWMEQEFLAVDWTHTVAEIHNQVRTFRFATSGVRGPLADVNGDRLEVLKTRTEPSDGIRVECANAPIWIVESAQPQAQTTEDLPWVFRDSAFASPLQHPHHDEGR